MSVKVSNDPVKPTDLTNAILGDPSQTVPLALEHIVGEVRSGAATLTPDDTAALKELIAANEDPATSSSSSPELAKTGGQEITLQGSQAIEIYVQVNGQTVRAVLSDASFGMSRTDQNSFAEGLGGRLATRKENFAVVNALLNKEDQGNLNPAEAELLKTYRDLWVRDSQGSIDVDRRFGDDFDLKSRGYPNVGALVVLPLAESK